VPRGVLICGAVIIAVVLAPGLPPVRTVVITAALVPEMIGIAPAVSSMTARPTRESTTYGAPRDEMHVYLPAGARPDMALPAVVLALGVHPQPIDHPDIAGLAEAIARVGVVVGVPDSTALRNLQVTPAEPGHLADAVLALAARPEVDASRVGLAGFSAGASICLVAATDPRLAGRLAWVSAFGGYADARRLLVDVATRTTTGESGEPVDWQPDPGIRRDVLELTLNALDDAAQRVVLRELLGPIVDAETRPSTPPVPERMTGDGVALYRLFTATERSSGEAAVASLGPELLAHLDGISPTPVADMVSVPVFLLHGRPDTAIPVVHAPLLRAAIGHEVGRMTIFGRFGHGQPGSAGLGLDDAGDIIELSLFLRDIVAAATE